MVNPSINGEIQQEQLLTEFELLSTIEEVKLALNQLTNIKDPDTANILVIIHKNRIFWFIPHGCKNLGYPCNQYLGNLSWVDELKSNWWRDVKTAWG